MRRRIAFLLAFILMFSSLNGLTFNLYASDDVGFEALGFNYKLSEEGLKYTKETGVTKKTTLEDKEACVSWDIKEIGEYILKYAIFNAGKTQNVELKFVLGADKDITVEAVKLDEGETKTTARDKQFALRQYNNAEAMWKSISVTATKGVYTVTDRTLRTGERQVGTGFIEQQLSMVLQDIEVNILIENEKIYVSTDKIQEGYVTDFELSFGPEGSEESSKVKGTRSVLKGLERFDSAPIFLSKGNGYKDHGPFSANLEQITTHPGIRVDIKMPKVYDKTTGKFETINDANMQGTLQIFDHNNSDNGLNLKFDMKNESSDIKDSTGAVVGHTVKNAIEGLRTGEDVISIFFTNINNKDKSRLAEDLDADVAENVVVWKDLKPSMLVDMTLSLSGGDIVQALPVNQRVLNPQNNGFTYLDYSISWLSQDTMQIEFKPYPYNGEVTYSLFRGTNEQTLQSVADIPVGAYQERAVDTIKNIGTGAYFRIEADLNGKRESHIYSQTCEFIASENIVPPSSPIIVGIDNINAVPGKNEGEQPQAVQFDIEWKPNTIDNLQKSKEEITNILNKTGDLYYELTFHKQSKANRGEDDSKVIKVYKVVKNGSDLKLVDPITNETIGDYTKDGTFRVSKVVLKDTDGLYKNINFNDQNDSRFMSNDYKSYFNRVTEDNYDITLPGTFYVSLRAIIDPNDTMPNQTVVYRDSAEKSIVIDIANEIIPVPSEIKAEDISNIVGDNKKIANKLTISKVDISKYVNSMVEPVGLTTNTGEENYRGVYEIFLYQKNGTSETRTKAELDNAMASSRVTRINNATTTSTIKLDGSQLDALRNGQILPIECEIEPLTLEKGENAYMYYEIENLDPNQTYYVVVRVRLDLFENGTLKRKEYSKTNSKVISFTTKTTPQEPKPEDKVPTTPENVKATLDEENDKLAIVTWDKAKMELDQNVSKIYYEVLRTEENELEEAKLYSTIKIDDLISGNDKIVGFSTEKDNIIKKTSTTDWTELTPLQSCANMNSYTLKDDSITSNKLYYYYVRTVCVIDGKVIRSSWVKAVITSSPVAPPENLKIESPKDYPHDTKYNIVVSFDAPVKPESINNKEYAFEFAIRSEDDSEYKVNAYPVTLKNTSTASKSGYTHYVYQISGLKSSKRYYIKVRIVDNTQKVAAGEEQPRSLYCEAVSTRTDYDKVDDDKNNKFEEYLRKFDQEIEKIKQRPYWESDSDNIYKYRNDQMKADINVSKQYDLYTGKNNGGYYYIPAKAFTQINENGVILNIATDKYTVSVRPNSITLDNEEIREVMSKIKDGNIEDYYIGIEVTSKNTNGKINNQEMISPEVTVNMRVIYLKNQDMVIESDLLMELQKIAESERARFKSRLENKVQGSSILKEDVLDSMIDEAIANVEKELMKSVSRTLRTNTKKEIGLSKPDKALLIVFPTDAYVADGYYYKNGTWINTEAYNALNGFAIEILQFGTYAITGQANLINTVPTIAPYQAFIAKYGLGEIFTLDEAHIDTAVTKQQLYGAVARVMGAPRNTDYIVYMKNQNIDGVSKLTQGKLVRQDEAIYIVMQGYERIHNRKVATIAVKNKQSVQNIGAFQPIYRDYVYAAVELKIVNSPDGKVLPSKQISVEEFIAMLSKMASN